MHLTLIACKGDREADQILMAVEGNREDLILHLIPDESLDKNGRGLIAADPETQGTNIPVSLLAEKYDRPSYCY